MIEISGDIFNVSIPGISDQDELLTATNTQGVPVRDLIGFPLTWLGKNGEEALTQGNVPSVVNADFLQVADGNVKIEAAGPDAQQLLEDLQALGLTDGVAFGNMVSGALSIEQLGAMANLESLQFARPDYGAHRNVGSTTSQGDVAMNADDARSTFSVDGTGITVGVLSDSYDYSSTASTSEADDIASGDLPSGISVLEEPSGVASSYIDEGRAMLQLVHDVAPDAGLAFHTAFTGQGGFAQGIIELGKAGADVIVDDVIYYAEPMFQDGIVAQAVDQVVANGIPYFSSAGNQGRLSYESAFNASGISQAVVGKTVEWHDFDPGPGVDITQRITVPEGTGFIMSFQWDEPFYSVSGGSGSASDVDIFIANGNSLIAGSFDSNIGGDPFEFLNFTNNDPVATEFDILIANANGGPPPGLMKYVLFNTNFNFSIEEYDTASGASYGHANAVGASSVGAARYDATPAYGIAPPQLEYFSSAGGTDILFDTDGNRLTTPESRQNVDIVAPDGTNTTFFGSDYEPDGFPNFFGTSAAAPHAAAVAALMLDAASSSGSLTPSQINSALETTAIDMESAGYDNDSGYGLIQADLAVEAVLPNNALVGTSGNDAAGDFATTPNADLVNGLDGNDIVNGLAGNDTLNGGEGNDSLRGQKGDDTLNGGDGNDTLKGGGQNDLINGYGGLDFLKGNAGDDTLNGGFGADSLSGGQGNDSLNGGYDNDSLDGNAGNDTLNGNGGSDTLKGANGSDWLDGGTGVDTLHGGADSLWGGADYLYGGADNDTLLGRDGDDLLAGNSEDDSLVGGAGSDTLIGGQGTDTLTGGDGNDIFVLGKGSADLITDFTDEIDLLDLSGTLTYDQLDIISSGSNTLIQVGSDGELLATLLNVDSANITELDFV